MVLFRYAADLADYLSSIKRPIAFIPTMGALHAGHRSLLAKAAADGYFTVVSIFVNPTQFNDPKDFEKYPLTPEADIQLLADASCDVLYHPPVEDVYPGGASGAITYDFGSLEQVFEGAQRPGHFKGVGQVVSRLLNIVNPDHLYLGQKDYQQCLVLQKLGADIHRDLQVHICPTVREADGLALSSRNRRLSEPERAVAGTIYQCLVSIQAKQQETSFSVVERECRDILEHKGFTVEYVSLADADTLDPLTDYTPGRRTIALIAARLGKTRLIDNMLLEQD
jgi:pantoate--beta-alanine ligase